MECLPLSRPYVSGGVVRSPIIDDVDLEWFGIQGPASAVKSTRMEAGAGSALVEVGGVRLCRDGVLQTIGEAGGVCSREEIGYAGRKCMMLRVRCAGLPKKERQQGVSTTTPLAECAVEGAKGYSGTWPVASSHSVLRSARKAALGLLSMAGG